MTDEEIEKAIVQAESLTGKNRSEIQIFNKDGKEVSLKDAIKAAKKLK